MNRQDKEQLVENLTQKFKESAHFYITDTSGIPVEGINTFRKMCHTKGVHYQVIKNTLIQKSLEQLNMDCSPLYNSLKGNSGIMFVPENANDAAKIIQTFKKQDADGRPKFKAASIDSDFFIGEDQLLTLLSLKSKNELVGEIIGMLQSPANNIISMLQNSGQKIINVLKTLSEKNN